MSKPLLDKEKSVLVPIRMTESMKKTIDERGKGYKSGKSEYVRGLITADSLKTAAIVAIIAITAIYSQDYGNLDAFDQAEKAAKTTQPTDTALNRDTTRYDTEEEINNLVYISVDDTVYEAIDRIQAECHRIKKKLSGNKYGAQLLALDFNDRRRYLNYLYDNNLMSEPALFAMADDLLTLKQLEYESAELVLSTQSGNQRARIFLHIKRLRSERDAIRSYVTYAAKRK